MNRSYTLFKGQLGTVIKWKTKLVEIHFLDFVQEFVLYDSSLNSNDQ
jgi:hypothetical protein